MTIYDKKAIQLKYEGYTYNEISKAIGGKMTSSTLRTYFSMDGRLYIPYLQYEAEQNQFIEQDIRTDYKKGAQYAFKIQRTILQKALKGGNLDLANQIVKDILDRAGVVVVRRAEVNVEEKTTRPIENYEQFVTELKRQGIDPRTGLRVAKA